MTTLAADRSIQHADPSARASVAPPEHYGLPAGYRQFAVNYTVDENRRPEHGEYWTPSRIAMSHRYQRHVYRWAARLVTKLGARSVLDVGCGLGTKLAEHILPRCADVLGLDQASAVERARARCPGANFRVLDLDRPALRADRTFDMILCVDVIEHLLDPDPVLRLIRSFASARTLALFSTPDRDRARGRDSMGGEKPEHVREWTVAEFDRFLRSRGFAPMRTRLLPQDDANPRRLHAAERAFVEGRARLSELSCQAVLCRVTPLVVG
ncbi:MAG: class I SAM-dependent methyltransferase [Phycisphaerae bacterium]|nr:class I SAM-dependent methyltransferase [Phycisphaerae bacterium]